MGSEAVGTLTDRLTPRESQVMSLLSRGLANREIAARLGVSVHTVKFHTTSIYRKLDVSNRSDAAAVFRRSVRPPVRRVSDEPVPIGELRRRLLTGGELELPTDWPRRPRTTMNIGREARVLPADLVRHLRALTVRLEARFETTVLAALAVLVHRYTRRGEVVIGFVPDHPERLLPLAVDFAKAPSLAALVEAFERELADERAQGVPLGLLRSDGAAGAPLPRVLFAVQGGPEAGSLPPPATTDEPYDVALLLETTARQVTAALEYDSDLFQHSRIDRMLGHLQTLLLSGGAAPDAPVRSLALLPSYERRRILKDWNATRRPYPSACVHELFADRAAASPQSIAVTMDGDSLTYGELDALANRFAHVLRALGVAPEVLVGVSAARSLEMVVGLLGVLKAGGAYVPIDPSLPPERKQFMVEEADVRILLTQQWLTEGLSPDGVKILYLDRDRDWIAAASAEPVSAATPENLAYVLYTSGATGKWKAVQITHRALVNFLTTMAERPGLGPDDVLVAVTTTAVDIAGLELYLPLISGARIVLSTHEVATNPVRLADLLERAGATVVQAPPSTWRMLIDAGWAGRPGLKVLCGGEPLPAQLADELLALEVELWIMYGPTETTIWSTIFPVRGSEEPLPVGRPIANTTLYILDEEHQPVPIGVPGKLHIGGHGLARGYLKHPELTAKRFIPHPFERDPESRIYRTSDLARYRADGNVEFVGPYEGKFPSRVALEPGEETVYGALRTRLEGRLTGFFKRRPALQSD